MDQYGYPPPPGPPPPGPPPQGPPPAPGSGRPAWILPVAIAVVVAVLGVAGWLVVSSGDDDDGDQTSIDSQTDDAEAETPAPTTTEATAGAETLTGTWEGTYECAQGTSSVTLTLADVQDGPVDGTFAFTTTGATGAAAGRYGVVGAVENGSLSLAGTSWIEEPAGFEMVGLDAEVADRDDPDTLDGTVVGEGCTSFALQRTTSEPWYIGEWSGKYDCAQGRTGITLSVTDDDADGDVEALYEFYEVPENPGVPSGSYKLTGHYEDRSLVLEPDEWVDQPTGYVMVGIHGEPGLVIGPEFLTGQVDSPDCQGFRLTKDSSANSFPTGTTTAPG